MVLCDLNAHFAVNWMGVFTHWQENDRKLAEKAAKQPLFVMGDMNTPSHLDWTEATRSRHCGWTYDWPATREFTKLPYLIIVASIKAFGGEMLS